MDPSAPSGHLLPFGYSSADRTSYVIGLLVNDRL